MALARNLKLIVEEGLPKLVAGTVKSFSETRDYSVEIIPSDDASLKNVVAGNDGVVVFFGRSGAGIASKIDAISEQVALENVKVAVCCEDDAEAVCDRLVTLPGASVIGLRAENFRGWLEDFYKALAAAGIPSQITPKYDTIEVLPASPTASRARNHGNQFRMTEVLENRLLTSPDYDRPAHCLKINLAGTDLRYNLGDHMVIYPENPRETVVAMAKRLGISLETGVTIGNPSPANTREPVPTGDYTVEELLTYFLDINGKASRRFLAGVAQLAQDEKEGAAIFQLAADMAATSEYCATSSGVFSYLKVLELYPSVNLNLTSLISMVPSLRPRSYSCASSPAVNPEHVECSFVVLKYPTRTGEIFEGLSTNYLATRKPGDKLYMTIRPINTPMKVEGKNLRYVGIALGSGVALLRGIAQHFDAIKKEGKRDPGKMLLYYGTRHATKDYVFGGELEEYAKNGVVDLYTSFSHDQKEFITPATRIGESPELLIDYIVDNFETTTLIYCGPAGPAWLSIEKAIFAAFEKVRPDIDAKAWIEKMKKAGKWCVQAYTPTPDPENPFACSQ